jgi:restriction endonuclease S subunit
LLHFQFSIFHFLLNKKFSPGATGILSYIDDYIFDEQLVLIGEDGAKWFCGANSSFIVNGKFWVNNHAFFFVLVMKER